jgi:hypothetical protein
MGSITSSSRHIQSVPRRLTSAEAVGARRPPDKEAILLIAIAAPRSLSAIR